MATATTTDLLEQLREQRKAKVEEWSSAIEAREEIRGAFETRLADEDESKRPTGDEIETYRAAETAFGAESDQRKAAIKELDRRIKEQKELVRRRKQAAKASDPDKARVTSSPLTYRKDNADKVSYFRDLAVAHNSTAASQVRSSSVPAATERLHAHGAEMDIEMPKRAEERRRRAEAQIFEAELRSSGQKLAVSPFERRVNPNRTDGQGGYFVPPLWLIQEYIRLLRAGRTTAGLCRQMDLPPGTDSVNIPKLSTGTLTGYQAQDAAGLPGQDYADTSVVANFKTAGGNADVAIQVIEMSPGQIVDQVIIEDLTADYNRFIDKQVLTGDGVGASSNNGGHILGLYPFTNWANSNTVTWTEASPVGYKFNQVLGAMVSQIATNRFDLTNLKFVMHPRRWFWFATQVDGNNRPLVESTDGGPWNVAALEESMAVAEGLVGHLPFGPPVYIDGNVPTTDTNADAAGGTCDVAIAAKFDDLWLFEDEPRLRVLPEVLSGTLELRYQIYNYFGFLARYGQSIAGSFGTGFAAPTGATTSVLF